MSENNSYVSALGFLLCTLRYTDHVIGQCRTLLVTKFIIISDLLLDFTSQPISSILSISITRAQFLLTLVFDRLFFETLKWSSRSSLESKFLACASYGLMTLSVFLFVLILRHISSSYPDIIEDIDKKEADNLDLYQFPSRNKYPQAALAREDLRSFVTVKVSQEECFCMNLNLQCWHIYNENNCSMRPFIGEGAMCQKRDRTAF